jgi:hypothetical protein
VAPKRAASVKAKEGKRANVFEARTALFAAVRARAESNGGGCEF